jgi:hypothetical protein
MTINFAVMLVGYEAAVEFTEQDSEDTKGSEGWSDEMIARMSADCKAFIALLEKTDLPDVLGSIDDYSDARLGHDFWLTRNHHGVGFWDRKELDFRAEDESKNVGGWLTDIAHSFPELNVYVGDDKMEYFFG